MFKTRTWQWKHLRNTEVIGLSLAQKLDASVSCSFPAAALNVGCLSQGHGIHRDLLSCRSDLFCSRYCHKKRWEIAAAQMHFLSLFFFPPPRNCRKPRHHPAACHLRPGGDGYVQQQAQTEAGPPQPGNRCAHITPHQLKKNPADVTQTYTTSQTLWSTGLRGACVHRRCRFTKHYTCCQ